LWLFLRFCIGYFVTVQPRKEECFHEYVKKDDKINMMYEVAEGGFLDIDVRIINARNGLIYDKQRETSGKVKKIKLWFAKSGFLCTGGAVYLDDS